MQDLKKETPTTLVWCVLKTGGPYNHTYVSRLIDGVKRNTTLPIFFMCLTDDVEVTRNCDCSTFALEHDWPGWWSKIELFRPDLSSIPGVYFDLDTVIKGNIDALLHKAHLHPFIALRGFNPRFATPGKMNFASGVMAGSFWQYSAVYKRFKANPERFMQQKQENWMHGDQGFIASIIGVDNVPRLQELLPENYIVGKKIITELGKIPEEAAVIAWSGEPRLHKLNSAQHRIHEHLYSLWAGVDDGE